MKLSSWGMRDRNESRADGWILDVPAKLEDTLYQAHAGHTISRRHLTGLNNVSVS